MTSSFFEKLYTVSDPTGVIPRQFIDFINENFMMLGLTLQGRLAGDNITDTIYGKTIRSGTSTSTTYVGLFNDGTLKVYRAGYLALAINSASPSGAIYFYDDSGIAIGRLIKIADTYPSFAVEAQNQSLSLRSPYMVYLNPGSASFTQNNGNLQVTGNLQVLGSKSCVQWTDEFDWVTLYANESLGSVFTEHGIGHIAGHRADIAVSPRFLACILPEGWHIQITPYGPASLYVHEIRPDGFTVGSVGDGPVDCNFAWTLTATRRGYPTKEEQSNGV